MRTSGRLGGLFDFGKLKTLSPLIIAGAGLLAIAMMIIVHYLQFFSSVTTTDLGQDYHAAVALRCGNTIYDGINHHVPFVAVLSLPLTFLSYRTSFVLWGVFSIVLYFVCVFIVVRGLDLRLGILWLMIPGLMLSWYPFLAHIALGQWSVVIAVCVLAAWLALKNGWGRSAGVLLGVAAAIKLFPGIFGLYLLTQRRWRALAYMGVSFSLCMIVSLIVVGVEDFQAFIFSDMPANSANFIAYPINHSLWGMTYRLLVPNGYLTPLVVAPRIGFALAAFLCILIIGLLIGGIRGAKDEFSKDIAYAATCVAMLMLSPLSWQHAMIILVLPFGVLLTILRHYNSWKIRAALICCFILTAIHDIPFAQMIVNAGSKHSSQWYWGIALLGPLASLVIIFAILEKQLLITNKRIENMAE